MRTAVEAAAEQGPNRGGEVAAVATYRPDRELKLSRSYTDDSGMSRQRAFNDAPGIRRGITNSRNRSDKSG